MKTVADRIPHLLAVLEAEERLYLELRDLLQREREVMVHLDPDALAEIVEMKSTFASEGRFLEEARIEACTGLGQEIGLVSPTPTLSELCAALGNDAGGLQDIHTRLVALLGAVKELVSANADFAGDSLGQVRSTLRLFGRLLPGEPTYAGDPAPTSGSATGRLVRRSV